ncbi:MAG: hypothetical protein HZB26_02720 [Candidatus Hydrogenedentes bacterium]|nr:hypothetical protein [Candidatus Hydrogenedentota bacterium]
MARERDVELGRIWVKTGAVWQNRPYPVAANRPYPISPNRPYPVMATRPYPVMVTRPKPNSLLLIGVATLVGTSPWDV